MNANTVIYTSFLTTVKDPNVTKKPFSDVVQAIKTEQHSASIAEIRNEPNEQEQKRLKRENLPVFFPTLVFGSHYALDEETDTNGIVQFDVDVKDNVDLDFKGLRQQIQAVPELFYLYTSPRGGLKFGIKTDFNRHANEGEESLKARYKTAYELSKEYVSTRIIINFFYDPNMQTLKTGCYLSSDPEIYFNEDCDTFRVDDRCLYSVPAASRTKTYDALTEEQVIEFLSFIPQNLRNDARLPINLAVMSVLGNSAISLLESHWTTSDKVKLKSDLNYQLKKINEGSFTGKVGLLIEMAKENGYVPPRATRLANRINFDFEKVDHTFPELYNDNNIAKSLDIAIEPGASQLLRISTGGGKSDKVAEVISGKPRKDTYLLLCDTNENIDKHVERINKYYSKRVTNPLKIPDTPITLEDLRYKRNNPSHNFSRAVSIKGKIAMCNKINPTIDFDLAFQKKYSNYIPKSVCDKCYIKETEGCNFENQADYSGFGWSNVFVSHFNTLYNESSELFKKRIPELGNIKAIIVDENAIQHVNNGVCRCIIANDIVTDKSVTNHSLLIEIFKSAYNLKSLNLSTDEIKNLPVIYGQELKSLIDNVAVDFNVTKVLKKYTSENREKRIVKTGNPFPTRTDIYENALNYLSTKDEKYLFGMRISAIKIAHAGFIQGEIKKINDIFSDTKITYLDATMNMDLVYDAILQGKDVEKVPVDIKMSDDIKIFQMTGISCSKSALQNNNRLLPIIEHAKKHIAEHGLQNKKGGLITFKKHKISDVIDENFVDTAAKLLWGDDYQIAKENHTRYFGNTRGYDEMKDCDYMILIGDYNLPIHALEDQFWNLYGEPVDLTSHAVDHLNRMADGSCIKTKKKQYLDPRLQSIYEHSCTAELEQALGRGRLIYGKSKTILVYSSMPLGDNVEITKFIDPNDIFPRQVVDSGILEIIKMIGFIQNKRKPILDATGLTIDQWNDCKDDIFKNFLEAGFVEEAFTYMKSKKYKTETYLVFDQVKFDSFKLSINA